MREQSAISRIAEYCVLSLRICRCRKPSLNVAAAEAREGLGRSPKKSRGLALNVKDLFLRFKFTASCSVLEEKPLQRYLWRCLFRKPRMIVSPLQAL